MTHTYIWFLVRSQCSERSHVSMSALGLRLTRLILS